MLKILSNMKLTESEPKSRKAKFAKDFAMVYCFFLTFFLIDISKCGALSFVEMSLFCSPVVLTGRNQTIYEISHTQQTTLGFEMTDSSSLFDK